MPTETCEHHPECGCGKRPCMSIDPVPLTHTLACGIHWTTESRAGLPCYKCDNENDLRRRGLLQHDGTPWPAMIGGRVANNDR